MLDWRVDGSRPNHSFEADAAKGAAALNSNLEAMRDMGIEADLAEFDGKDITLLKRIAERHPPGSAKVDELLSLASRDAVALQSRATKLLKWWQEQGLSLSDAQTAQLLNLLAKDIAWESRLQPTGSAGG